MSKAKKIVDEIVEKVQDYETSQASFLEKVGEWGDLFRVRRPSKKANTHSNPRLTEFFRSVNALATMMYRMQTSQDPFFEVAPMQVGLGSDQLLKIHSTLETQLMESGYKHNLLTANMSVVAFGTVIVEENYEILGINSFGRRLPVTTFKPRSMLQVAFDRGTTNLDEADWLTTSDLISNSGLMRLAGQKDIGQAWNKSVLEFAAKEQVKGSELNRFVMNKLTQLGYGGGAPDKAPLRKEILPYYGKLDCLNDGIEYVAVVINRRHLVRFHPNKNQHGQRNFRTAYWIRDPLTLDPLGLGLGSLVGDYHKSMDANRQRVQDGIVMDTYNMMIRMRSAGIDDADLKIKPLQIIDSDERDGITPIRKDPTGIVHGLKLEELMRAEFKQATGATEILQAVTTDSTATEAALSQNEAVRNISVKAELISEPLVRGHLRIMHSNNVEFINEPINVNSNGNPQLVYPAELRADVDFRLKMTTDKDYKPKRIQGLQELLATLVSTKSMHPDLQSISIVPIVEEIARGLNVPVERLRQQAQQDPMAMLQQLMMGGGAPGGGLPPAGGAMTDPMAGPEASISTPMGDVPGSVNG
jgi:hypothetical protein